jgi:hypothetical protein
MNGYSKIRRTPEEEAKAIAGAKAYWEGKAKEKTAPVDPFEKALASDAEKEAESHLMNALGKFSMIVSAKGR